MVCPFGCSCFILDDSRNHVSRQPPALAATVKIKKNGSETAAAGTRRSSGRRQADASLATAARPGPPERAVAGPPERAGKDLCCRLRASQGPPRRVGKGLCVVCVRDLRV